jgi:hypothetical protein
MQFGCWVLLQAVLTFNTRVHILTLTYTRDTTTSRQQMHMSHRYGETKAMKKARVKREQRAEGRKSERSERTNAIREKYVPFFCFLFFVFVILLFL